MAEKNRLNLDLLHLVDEDTLRQNCLFFATQIKDDNDCLNVARTFLKLGVKGNYEDTLKQTALYYACRDNRLKLIDLLVTEGCNVNHIDTYGQSPIFYACREGNIETIRKL